MRNACYLQNIQSLRRTAAIDNVGSSIARPVCRYLVLFARLVRRSSSPFESREYRATHNAVLVVHREENQFLGELRHAGDRWPSRMNWSRRFPSDSAAVRRHRTGRGYGESHRDDTTYRRSSCLADTAKCKSLRLAFAKRKNHSLFRQSSIQRRLPLPCPGGAKRGDVMRESRAPARSGWR